MDQRFGFVFLGLLLLASVDTDHVRDTAKESEPELEEIVIMDREIPPIDGPQCPKFNASGEQLVRQVAERGDDREWTVGCEYE